MKRSYLAMVICLIFISCEKEDIDNSPGDGSLQGEINGVEFNMNAAKYEEISGDRLQFEIFAEMSAADDVCDFSPSGYRVFFVCEDTDDRQDLFLDLQNFEGFTITLFEPANANNIIATEGYFEITARDGNLIEAVMDVTAVDDTFVKGSFVAELCE